MTTNITELALRLKLEAHRAVSNFNPQMNIKTRDLKELVEALEKAQRANGYLREQSAEWERKAISNFEDCAEMSARVEKLESQRKLAFTASNRWADKFREAEKRIAELESRTVTVKLPYTPEPSAFAPWVAKAFYQFHKDTVKSCVAVFSDACAAAGIKVEDE
ncbi:hypothetical protein VLL38_003677 [Klebsiella pneumoniae]|uniref:hypothetical protein n=1 Tax=Klebsiella pneumoniae TaxID=573 RepID=UPI000807EC86|nr:hypothetical protein [Klebsiella pneumoniae]EMC8497199.1 hypothetical protein [Klebsiella pneumoniae]SBW66367.1 Uncharacterised protein [Klebsiella pneumoniae]SBY50290.1 Uncharacterised protein [Klebsiella pneumoniae]